MDDENTTKKIRPKGVALDNQVYLDLRQRAFDTFDDMKALANRYIKEGLERDKQAEQAVKATQ